MAKENNNTDNLSAIRDENTFLKMKMALENGASFKTLEEIPPELENLFLKNVMEFEKQSAECRQIKIFEKVGSPSHFKKPDELLEKDIDKAWKELQEWLADHAIELLVFSPNVSTRELYRFCWEELFELEMDDLVVPGMMNCFVYDEFHPDHKYENTRIAVEECLKCFFGDQEFAPFHYAGSLKLNNHDELSQQSLKYIVNNFRYSYDSISMRQVEAKNCVVSENHSIVSGIYEIVVNKFGRDTVKRGNWKVELEANPDHGLWQITSIDIKGIRF
jgi:hypothetical protein